MSAQLWQHKPAVKEAIEWTGDNAAEIIEWADGKAYEEAGRFIVRSPQGDLVPAVGDWVVRGIEGEFYPVPRTIFLGSYEYVGDRS